MGGQRSVGAVGPLSTVLLLVLVMFAGCTDDGRPQGLNAPATFDDSTGGIEGLVVDDETLPVVGAQVGILALGLSTVSEDSGRFTFSNVPPGEHQIDVIAVGFHAERVAVTVTAGELATPEVQLRRAATLEVHSITQIQRGLFGCGTSWRPAVAVSGIAVCGVFGISDELVGTNTSAYDKFLLLWKVPNSTAGGWNASIFEMKWDSNQVAGKGLSMIWEVDGCSNVGSMRFARIGGRSPLWANASGAVINRVITKAPSEDGCDDPAERCNVELCEMHSRVFSQPDTFGTGSPADIGVTFQQSFEQYHTSFYWGPPPDGWSALK